MDIMKKPSTLDNRSTSPSKSLNRDARRKEFQRINEDNQVFFLSLFFPIPYPLSSSSFLLFYVDDSKKVDDSETSL